jgi:hypothetical protein
MAWTTVAGPRQGFKDALQNAVAAWRFAERPLTSCSGNATALQAGNKTASGDAQIHTDCLAAVSQGQTRANSSKFDLAALHNANRFGHFLAPPSKEALPGHGQFVQIQIRVNHKSCPPKTFPSVFCIPLFGDF